MAQCLAFGSSQRDEGDANQSKNVTNADMTFTMPLTKTKAISSSSTILNKITYFKNIVSLVSKAISSVSTKRKRRHVQKLDN